MFGQVLQRSISDLVLSLETISSLLHSENGGETVFAKLTSLTVAILVLSLGASASDQSRVKQGKAISPVKLNLQGKNAAKVALGSYLVNAVGGCNDCHSCPSYEPGHNPYAGGDGKINATNYLAGGVNFGPGPDGDIISKNLTPQPSHGNLPAGLTLQQFKTTIRTGHDPEGDLLLVMPWPIFRNMTDHDLEAIYAFLTAIPPAEPGTCSMPGQ